MIIDLDRISSEVLRKKEQF